MKKKLVMPLSILCTLGMLAGCGTDTDETEKKPQKQATW